MRRSVYGPVDPVEQQPYSELDKLRNCVSQTGMIR